MRFAIVTRKKSRHLESEINGWYRWDWVKKAFLIINDPHVHKFLEKLILSCQSTSRAAFI